MDKKCDLCEKYFPTTAKLKKHITDVHDGLKNPWELWLGGFFDNNWFVHIGKKNFLKYCNRSNTMREFYFPK